jgi:zinc and cadmium transporter
MIFNELYLRVVYPRKEVGNWPIWHSIAYIWLKNAQKTISRILAISVASFIYIAAAVLIPHLHQKTDVRSGIAQVFLLLCGVGIIMVFATSH